MSVMWLVLCRSCGKHTTVSPPPHSVEFRKEITCVLCGRMIDASVGRMCGNTVNIEQEPIDLLEVL